MRLVVLILVAVIICNCCPDGRVIALHEIHRVQTCTYHVTRLSIIISVTHVELVKVARAMDNRVPCVVAGVGVRLHGMEVVVASVVAVLPISSTEVVGWALERAEWAVMRSKADLRCSRIVRAPIMITAVNLVATASTNYVR